MAKPTGCPKCQGAMEEGFVKDEGYGTVSSSTWIEGAPEKSFWTGTKTAGKKQFDVSVYRCVTCGYLESYAI
jgi:hypothetical protein